METKIKRITEKDTIEGFDPTYKGWKRGDFRGIERDEGGFDPTYKGWKPWSEGGKGGFEA